MRGASAWLSLLAIAVLGCSPQSSYRLSLLFPSEDSEAEVRRVYIRVFEAGELRCEHLEADQPDPDSLVARTELDTPYPPESTEASLPKVPMGNWLFFAQAMREDGEVTLQGCTLAEVAARRVVRIEIVLEERCVPDPEGEIQDNGIDDDCDGVTDECVRDTHCDDDNSCTADFCTNGTCLNNNLPDETRCEDGNGCTVDDECQQGSCVGSLKDCSAFNSQCTLGHCDQVSNECGATNRPEGTTCDDGRYCTTSDGCLEGLCTGTDRACNDDDPCTEDGCDDVLLACTHDLVPRPNQEGPPGNETCSNSQDDDCDELTDLDDPNCRDCTDPADCDDTNPCTLDDCVAGICQNQLLADDTPCPDSLYCTVGEVCTAGTCRKQERDCTAQEDDCNFGVCLEDGDVCGKQPKADNIACDDGAYCTEGDLCLAGACQPGSPRDCDDNDHCTADTCDDQEQTCVHTPETEVDPEGPPLSDSCHNDRDDDCDALTDLEDDDCHQCTVNEDCEDDNLCTSDTCVDFLCTHSPQADGEPCDDGSFCTVGNLCQAGVCLTGTDRTCDDGNACTIDSCNEEQDTCNHQHEFHWGAEGYWLDGTCDNLIDDDCDSLTDGDDPNCSVCADNGQCDDGNDCTGDSCQVDQCVSAPVQDGFPCDVCSAADTCQGGLCEGAQDACDDTNPCTFEWCDPFAGCTSELAPIGTRCGQGKCCNNAGVCQACCGTAADGTFVGFQALWPVLIGLFYLRRRYRKRKR